MAQNEVEDMQNLKREAEDKEKAKVYIDDLNDISINGIVYAGTDANNKPLQNIVAKNRNNGYCITLVYTELYKKQIYHFQDNSSRSFVRTCNNGVWTEWTEQVSIIETITNANGTAIKFSDGTMKCILNVQVTDQAINGQYGNTLLYTGSRTWTFPVPFVETPTVTCSMFKWGTGASWGGVSEVVANSATLLGYDFYSRPTGTRVIIQATAEGKWK